MGTFACAAVVSAFWTCSAGAFSLPVLETEMVSSTPVPLSVSLTGNFPAEFVTEYFVISSLLRNSVPCNSLSDIIHYRILAVNAI